VGVGPHTLINYPRLFDDRHAVGHVRNVRQSSARHGKPDWMIVGQGGGLVPPMAAEPGQAAPLAAQKSPPFNFQNDTLILFLITLLVSARSRDSGGGRRDA
jgi:hypothetical protein